MAGTALRTGIGETLSAARKLHLGVPVSTLQETQESPGTVEHGCHANAALHNRGESPYMLPWEDQQEPEIMGFRTEFFSRPRPKEENRFRAALAMLNSMSNADLADIGIKPADFPRLAREMSLK
jgi:uncharacterized protein YjiS (DUF1127 family)